jgi:hypothetical protein
MGVSIWVRLKRDIADVDPLAINGKLLAKAIDELDRASHKLKVRPLSDFYSVSKKQALAEAAGEDLTEEEWEALADDHVWWPPAEGLASVTALLTWVTDHPDEVPRWQNVVEDLRHCRTVLEAAVRDDVEFNIAVDA